MMFGIGFGELILILAAALIFIGPDKLPGLAKSLARALNEFKKAGDEIKSVITEAVPGKDSGQKSYAAKGQPQTPPPQTTTDDGGISPNVDPDNKAAAKSSILP